MTYALLGAAWATTIIMAYRIGHRRGFRRGLVRISRESINVLNSVR